MAVPVVLNNTTFDFVSIKNEQRRVSTEMLNASPREIKDTSQVLEVQDDATPPNKYPTFIRAFFSELNQEPVYELYMKDNFDKEFKLSNTGSAIVINNGDNKISPANFTINSRTGEILNEAGTVVGGIKFDGITGLSLASLNARLTDVNNTFNGLTKVLNVANASLDAAINTIR